MQIQELLRLKYINFRVNSQEKWQDGISLISRRTRADRDNIIHWVHDKEDSMRWGYEETIEKVYSKIYFLDQD